VKPVKSVVRGVVLLLFTLSILIPIGWVLVSSLKSGPEIFGSPWKVPAAFKFENYTNAWSNNEYGIGPYFGNTMFICAATILVLLPLGSMAAYVLAKYPFPGSKFIFGTLIGGMMFPNFLIIVPLFFLLKSIDPLHTGHGLVDTKTGLILVYVAYSLSFTIFVMSGFFQALPSELAEAAMIDGCGHAETFFKVMLPLVRPGLIVVGIFNAIGLWNEFGLALVLMSDKSNRTLSLAINDMVMTHNYESDWGALFAGLVIVMTPVMIVYWIFRERIQQAMLAGAIKG